MASKTYSAHEIREAADNFWVGGVICEVKDGQGRIVKQIKDDAVIAMLRQAADAEDELAQLKASKDRWMQYQETAAGERDACIDELRKKDAEIAQLKARLGLS